MNLGSSIQNMTSVNPIDIFIMSNPMFLLMIFMVIFLIYVYVTADFRFKRPHFFAYSTRLDEQVSYWTENFAEDVMSLYKLDTSNSKSITTLKALFGTAFNTNLIIELKQKTNAVLYDETDVIGDFSKMAELLQERLTWSFVTVHDDDNIYEQNAQTRFAVFDLILFMLNNFANLKEQNMLFYLNNDFEDNVKYFVNKAKNKYNENTTSPSLNKHAQNDIVYLPKSIIPYVNDATYFESLTNMITLSEDGKLPDKIEDDVIHNKYKEVLRSLFNKVIDILEETTAKKDKNLSDKLLKDFDNFVEDNPIWKDDNSVIKKNDKLLRKFFHTKDNYFSSYFDKIKGSGDEVDTELLKNAQFDEFMESNYDNYITKLKTLSEKNKEKGIFEHEDRFKFEKFLFEFETDFGQGMLMKDYSFVEQTILDYHNVINLHYYNMNTEIVQKAYQYKDSITEDMISAFFSLHRLHIALSVEFPKILHYDTKHSVDIGRLKMYYNSLFKKFGKKVSYYINAFTSELPKLYTEDTITMHKKFNNFLVNMLINIIQYMRDYFRWIRENLGKYIKDTVNGAIEGYKDPKVKELIEKFNNTTDDEKDGYRDSKNNVVEPFVGKLIKGIGKSIAKPFLDVIKSFKVILKILTLITNPVAIIKLMVAVLIMIATIMLSFIDIVKIITGTLAAIVIAVYLIITIVYLFYYTIVMQVIRLFDINIFKGYLHKFLYEYFFANEKDIRNWFMTPSYEQGNESNRPLLIPFSECVEGFKPGILFCHKISSFVPTYSYYANIHRRTEGIDLTGNVYMKEFKPDANFHKYSKNKKNRIIKRVNMEKDMYLKKMKKRLTLYNDLTKATCFSVDSIEGIEDTVKTEIKQLCSNLYCQNGNFETFCSSYNTLMNKDYNYDIIETYIHLTSYILMIIAITFIITISFHDEKLLKELPNNVAKIFKPFNKVTG